MKQADERIWKRLSEEIKAYKDITPENYVYSLMNENAKTKIREVAEHFYRIKVLFSNDVVRESKTYQIFARFVEDQIDITGGGKVIFEKWEESE